MAEPRRAHAGDIREILAGSPAPAVPKVGILGHSKVRQNHDYADMNIATVHGWMTWTRFLLGQRFDSGPELNYGIGGEKSDEILKRIPAMLRAHPDVRVWVVQAFTNDNAARSPVPDWRRVAPAIQAEFTTRGLALIWLTDDPRGDRDHPAPRLSGADLARAFDIRRWQIEQRAIPGVYTVDTWELLADQLSETGDARPGRMWDGLHEVALGAYEKGILLARVLRHLFPPRFVLPASNGDASLRSRNPYMGGTDGRPGGGNEGSLADGFLAFDLAATGTRLRYAKPEPTSGFLGSPYDDRVPKDGWQEFALTGTATGAHECVVMAQALRGQERGEILRAVGEIEIDRLAGVAHLGVVLFDDAGQRRLAADMDHSPLSHAFPGVGGVAGVCASPPWVCDRLSPVSLRLVVKLLPGAQVDVAARVRGFGAMRVG
ncbi:SGNH/GDSL hydrolase family protein [Aureimonas sp. ME7]|uniref:SGNH/GDSL hydrolase family protein n=1 Tax=Aureimonas sp. ME7 TaxID=2744252 RepID=UPI0015F64A99|nr:SGNH/GDSL hydrolase family protein [Aureimonas sp. ME7]